MSPTSATIEHCRTEAESLCRRLLDELSTPGQHAEVTIVLSSHGGRISAQVTRTEKHRWDLPPDRPAAH